MSVLYNEIDTYCCDWLSNLMDAGLISPGKIDDRSIVDLGPDDLRGYTRVHLFAGIAGWEEALRISAWPIDRPVWTFSPPCQPFSAAGLRRGVDDERHLWPHVFRLLRACRPASGFGEQVAAAIGLDWLDGVSADLESVGYACRPFVLPACAVNAPQRRDRLYFAVHDTHTHTHTHTHGPLDHGDDARLEGHAGHGDEAQRRSQSDRPTPAAGIRNHWADAEWIECHDGKWRRTEPGVPLVAARVPGRVGKLRAFGNGIVPPLAAELMRAYQEEYPTWM